MFDKYAVANRFDKKETVYIKRILQTVLPECLRNKIASELFEEIVGIEEEKFAKELYMSKEQIKLLKNSGMYIGLHGYDHYWLNNLKSDELEQDLNQSLESMNGIIDENCWVMNYPYGAYNDNVIENIKSKGCKLGFSTEVRVGRLDKDNIFALPRLDTNDFPPKSEQYLKLK